ncbi:helix-turn-helix transcriptional regulator [Lactococcus raffinolactis]|uniref:helix-turn-helix domain-containing protein n=1 Tax=Pseudolactococcus raffinolactis TaxID=1366 RepID=UPI002891C9C7|nr:helix-turn-helix transcriptional regulator [Lactococcus raffinolactis]MDT2767025.1 helix-turn-helix transcriptional regulator [Lactococcus raffinolactis]MDT2790140.1 helix-turn-helix transcriptional regulator [Lactococcus raffinolactis]
MLPERLKTLRLEAKLTQNEIAKKLQISKMTYSYWENGKRNPKNVQQIADFFNVSTDYLLGNTDIKNQKQFDEDLEKSLDTFKSFDGKPMYDEDREKIREFLRKRMEDRLKDN